MKRLLLLCVLGLYTGVLWAQCPTPTAVPASGACPTTGTVLTTATTGTLAAGTTYYYSSATLLSLTNLTIKGTLYVCGNLSINTLNFSGTPNIIVEPGGTLTIYTGSIKGDLTNYGTLNVLDGSSQVTINGQIANYGTTTFGDAGANSGTGIQGNNAAGDLIYNGVGATFTVHGTSLNNTPVSNFGQMYFDADLNQQNSSICEGNDAIITVADFNDDMTPGISLDAPGDKVGLDVTQTLGGSSSNGTLANSANVYICEAPGITIGAPYDPGSATIETNCTSLNTVLPIILESFTVNTGSSKTCVLNWTTASENGLLDFVPESSADARTFSPLGTVPANGVASSYTYPTPLGATTWFRLRLNDTQGDLLAYSPVLQAVLPGGVPNTENYLKVQPSLVTDNTLSVQSTLTAAQSGYWMILDMMGRTVLKQQTALVRGTSGAILSLPLMAPGVYILSFQGGAVPIAPVRFVVVH